MSTANFEKHVYGRQKKRSFRHLEDFDPRPSQYQITAKDQLKGLLEQLRGKGLCISLMFDPESQYWHDDNLQDSLPPVLPSKTELQDRVRDFKDTLKLPPHKIREIEQNTRDQSQSPLWFSVRKYRLTASYFGEIRRRQPTTSPHSLVMRIIGAKQFKSPATDWGKSHESIAIKQYIAHQHATGHQDLYCCRSGFVISEEYPFLGASPDGLIFYPNSSDQFGVLEVKCPYSYRNCTPMEACSNKDFCSSLVNVSCENVPRLKHDHQYYSQVQGQMAIAGRKWCDFVIYTEKGLNIERISFDENFWQDLLPKLIDFFDNCLGPEIVSPLSVLGMPVRDLRNMQ